MKTILALFVVVFISYSSFGQEDDIRVLLLGEFSKDEEGEQVQNLVGLYFNNGKFLKKDTIVSGPTFKKVRKDDFDPYFRLEFTNKLYKDRYLITFRGPVVDIKKGKLYDVDGELKEKREDTLIFFTENIFKGTYYTYLNLANGVITKKYIEDYKRDYSEATVSPDKKTSINVDYSKLPYRITLTKNGKKQVIVENAGYGTPYKGSATFPLVPVHWIDSTRFLYGRFDLDKKNWKHTGCIVLYDTRFQSEIIIGYLGVVKEFMVNSKFMNSPDDGLLFTASRRYFKVNVDAYEIKEISRIGIGNGFSYDLFVDEDWKQKLFFNGEQISNFHFIGEYTTKDYIAVGIRDKGTFTGPDRVGIWNRHNKSWLILPEPDLIDIIGWISPE